MYTPTLLTSLLVGLLSTLPTLAFPHPNPHPQPALQPPKKPFTPYFHLQVAHSPNTTLPGHYIATADYTLGDYLRLTPNKTSAALFYQSTNVTNNEHPHGGSVLVHNVSGAGVSPGANLIAGQSSGLTDPDAGLPIEASVFTKRQVDWDDFGSYEMDFGLVDFFGKVRFQTVQGKALEGWTKTSACWFNVSGFILERFVVLDYYPGGECSEVHLKWVFAEL